MSVDYWETHTVQEHEEKIRQLNEKFVAGKVSREDVKREIAHLFGEDTPEFEQEQRLEAEISSRISSKAREKMTAEQYLKRRAIIREQILHADEQAEQEAKEGEARVTGNICIKCGSHNVHSKGAEWICENGHRFRKH